MTDYAAILQAERARSGAPSISAAVLKDFDVAWLGSTDDASAQYRIGSITKTFIAVEIMRLRDEGKLDIADQVGRFLPELSCGHVTLAQLLTHTSGLQAETNGPWWERNEGTSWAELASSGITTCLTSGTRFHYSNVGFAVLGRVVEVLRGRPWFEAIADSILTPLQMSRTSTRPEAPAVQGYAVHPHEPLRLAEPEFDAGAMAPAGQLWSTVSDLARWALFIAGDTGDVLAPSTLEEMQVALAVVDLADEPFADAQGLGLHIAKEEGRRLVGHGGSMPGFVAGLWVDPDHGDGFVTLANSTGGIGDISSELLGTAQPKIAAPVEALPEVADLLGDWWWGPQKYSVSATVDGLHVANSNGRRSSRFVKEPGGWVGLDTYFAGEHLRVVDPQTLNVASFILTREPYPDGDWEAS